MTVIESILAETFGVPRDDPKVKGATRAIAPMLDHNAVTREEIRRDPETDYKVLAVRHRVSHQTVYRAWREILTPLRIK